MISTNIQKVKDTITDAYYSDSCQNFKSSVCELATAVMKDDAFVKVFAATTVGVLLGLITFLPVQACATVGAIVGVYHAIVGRR